MEKTENDNEHNEKTGMAMKTMKKNGNDKEGNEEKREYK